MAWVRKLNVRPTLTQYGFYKILFFAHMSNEQWWALNTNIEHITLRISSTINQKSEIIIIFIARAENNYGYYNLSHEFYNI